MRKTSTILLLVILINPIIGVFAQTKSVNSIFDKIKILEQKGKKAVQRSVIVEFTEDEMIIKAKSKAFEKSLKYTNIQNAEYSYSKKPRWKTGLGMGAASVLFPPLLLVAIPIGFTKHRRHWFTVRTENDFAILKLSKKNRKIFIPTFETKSGVTIKAVGEDK